MYETPSDGVLERVRSRLGSQLDAASREWLDAAELETTVDDWFADQCSRCTDEAWGRRFAEHCPVPGAGARDYSQRWIEVDGDWHLFGIRMQGTNIDRPFVDLVATSAAGCTRQAWEAAFDAYRVFSPTRGRVRGTLEPPPGGATATLDQVYVAGRVHTIAASGGAAELEPLDDLDEGNDFVRDTYAAWRERRSWMAGRVEPLPRDLLLEAQGKGTAWWIRGDGLRVGLVATTDSADREWSGHVVMEEIVAPAFAGRGWAARAQRAVAAELAERSHRVLFGTIDASNEPSIRAALAAGRRRVGAYWWVSLGGS